MQAFCPTDPGFPCLGLGGGSAIRGSSGLSEDGKMIELGGGGGLERSQEMNRGLGVSQDGFALLPPLPAQIEFEGNCNFFLLLL